MAMADDGRRPVIWRRDPSPRRGPRPAHTRDEIARAAVAIADAQGLDQVSIRAVAKELGAGAASLYRYIDTKADLHDLMGDRVVGEIVLPARPSGDWRADLRLIADRSRLVHRRHPWALTLLSEVTWGPRTQAYMEFLLAVLALTALDLAETMEFVAHFTSAVATFAVNERPGPLVGDPAGAAARIDHLQQIAEDPALPHLARAVQSMLTAEPVDMDAAFRGVVERLLSSVPSDEGPSAVEAAADQRR